MIDAEKAAETWLRDKYGAYRGHPCWREIEAGYLAGYAAAQTQDAIVNWFGNANDEQRDYIFSKVCRHCGTLGMPCYCWNDE